MKRRIPTINEFVDQKVRDKRQQSLPSGQRTFKEIIIVLEFPHSMGDSNFNTLKQELDKAFNENGDIRVEQEFGEVGQMTRAVIHVKDVPQVQTKIDNALSNLDFSFKVIGSEKFE
jgi:hypothetical protein